MFFFKKKKIEKSEKIKNAFPPLPTTRVISERLLGTAVDKTNIVINSSRRTTPPDGGITECVSPSFDLSTKDSSLKGSLKESSLKESSLKEPSLNEESSLKEPGLSEQEVEGCLKEEEPSLTEQQDSEEQVNIVEEKEEEEEESIASEETDEGCGDQNPSEEEEWGMTRQHGLAPNLRLDRPRPNRQRHRSSSSSSSSNSSSSNKKVYAPTLNMEDILQEPLAQEDESTANARSSPSSLKPRGPRIPRLTARKIPPPSPPQSPVTTKNKDPLLTTPNKKATSHLPVPIAPQKRTDVRKNKPARCGLPVACNTTKLPVRRAS
ncbi:hypothetical protein BJV82DRAFT_591027 [Fennellomyces sp. T-0311]|nr:hypothetical protein BJV82DRAFT_591027 [Fennellomyces sp. T-0311]